MTESGANIFGAGEPDIRRPLDMAELDSEASEFSWGAGIDVPGTENKPPSEGGRYQGQSPPCDPIIGVGGA